MEGVPNFQLFSRQNSDLDNKLLDEIEQKAQAKNTKRATECMGSENFWEIVWEKKITVGIKTVSPTDLRENLWTFFAEVKTEKAQALTPSAMSGIRAAIHRHLTCAPLSWNINISQGSKFTFANKMFEVKAKLFYEWKQCKTKTQIVYLVWRHVEIESILHGRAEHGRCLERCREVSWVYLVFHCVFTLLALAERNGRGLQGSHLN